MASSVEQAPWTAPEPIPVFSPLFSSPPRMLYVKHMSAVLAARQLHTYQHTRWRWRDLSQPPKSAGAGSNSFPPTCGAIVVLANCFSASLCLPCCPKTPLRHSPQQAKTKKTNIGSCFDRAIRGEMICEVPRRVLADSMRQQEISISPVTGRE